MATQDQVGIPEGVGESLRSRWSALLSLLDIFNSPTADKLKTPRNIGGVAFDGSADINLPGVNQAGTQATSGNAATATKLQTARTIGGVSFDGSANINLPGVNTAGNQNTSGKAANLSSYASYTTNTGGGGGGGTLTWTVPGTSYIVGESIAIDVRVAYVANTGYSSLQLLVPNIAGAVWLWTGKTIISTTSNGTTIDYSGTGTTGDAVIGPSGQITSVSCSGTASPALSAFGQLTRIR